MGCKVALLTGRGGSSLNDKNIRKIRGLESLKYPAISANKSKLFDWTFCSSDDDKILSCAEEVGFKKIIRPPELASANALHKDVINHALNEMATLGLDIDYLFVFLANNVCVTPSMISDAYKLLVTSGQTTSVVPAYMEFDRHPLRSMKLSSNGLLVPFVDNVNFEKISSNRQELEPAIFLSHNFWAISLKNQKGSWKGIDPWPFLGDKIMPLIIEETYDIHEEEDFFKAKSWLEKNNIDYSPTYEQVLVNASATGSLTPSRENNILKFIEGVEILERDFFSDEQSVTNLKKYNSTFYNKLKIDTVSIFQILVLMCKRYLPSSLKRFIKTLISKTCRRI